LRQLTFSCFEILAQFMPNKLSIAGGRKRICHAFCQGVVIFIMFFEWLVVSSDFSRILYSVLWLNKTQKLCYVCFQKYPSGWRIQIMIGYAIARSCLLLFNYGREMPDSTAIFLQIWINFLLWRLTGLTNWLRTCGLT
jgi:hypothetical protein